MAGGGVMMKGTKAVAGMNIKRLVFGICVAFVLCAFAGVASARWYVEEGQLVHAVGDEAVIPFYNNIITPHRMLFGRMIDEDEEYLAHEKHIPFYKRPIPKHELNKQMIRAAGTQKSNYTFSLHGNVNLLWSYVNDERNARVYFDIIRDVNSDGIYDVIISDNDVSDDEGNLLMLSGSDGSTVWSKNYEDAWVGIDDLDDDANGDGIYDVIVFWCKYDVSNKTKFGVDLLNGDDGTKIWSKLSSYDGEFDCIGIDADEFSDINGDGIKDVLVYWCREEDYEEEKTYLTIKTFNGVNGAEFWEKTVLYEGEWWGNWAHEAGGDMNGDGIEDVLLESEGWDAENDRGISEIQAFNGKTGLELWRKNFTGRPTRCHYACGDLNGDGLNDIVVNIMDWENNKCGVWAIRGYDGLVIWEKHFYGRCYASGWYDFNGDGFNDVLIENVDCGNKSAKILVAKGTDGTPLWEKYYDNVSDMDFTILDDINGDAIFDVCIALKTGSTEVQMLNGRTGSSIWTKTFAEDIGRINYCEDLDSDDKEDIVFLNTTEIDQTSYVYKLTALSGTNGNVLWKNSFTHVVDMEFPEDAWTHLWSWAYGWIDLNGDGLTDILLEIEWHCDYWDENASTNREYSDNKFVLVDGKDGSEIWDVEYTLDEYSHWVCLYTYVDFNNDRIKDVLLGTKKGVYLLTISEAANIPPTATIDSITPDPAIQGKDIVHFRGHGNDSDGSVVAYEWTSDKDGVLSNEEDFDMPASDLSVGTHIISFKVKDDDGVWSTADTEDLTIKPAEEYNPKLSVPDIAPLQESGYVGTTFQFVFNVTNKGTADDIIELSATDTASWHLELSKTSIALSPEESERVYLNVTAKDVGNDIITVKAVSKNDRTKNETANFLISTEKTLEERTTNPLLLQLDLSREPNHEIIAPDYARIVDKYVYISVFLDLNRTTSSIREITIGIKSTETGENVNLTFKLPDFSSLITTNFHIWRDGYNFVNWWEGSEGYCWGMSTSSLFFHLKRLDLPDEYEYTYQIPKDKASPIIRYFQKNAEKDLDEEKHEWNWGLDLKLHINESKEYENLVISLKSGKPSCIVLWEYLPTFPYVVPDPNSTHAVVAYKVVEDEDKAYIYIYDPNYPYKSSDITSYRVCIYNKTTEEFHYKWESGKEFLAFYSVSPSEIYLTNEKNVISIDCPVNATITDQYGRIIADNGTNEIPNASMLITNEIKTFYLPADLTYSVDIDAYDTGTFNFTRVSPVGNDISITKFENISVTESTKASVEIVPNVTNYTMSIDYNGDGKTDEEKSPDVSETIVIIEENIFDTGAPENPYPSISGTFNGTITPYKTIIVKNLYTYPCEGTGGHTEYVKIYNESGTIAEAEWKGYKGDWHNITFLKKFALEGGKTYNITIVTGSYPQIHHTSALQTENGWINCTEFTDANGKKYDDWIPAIMLWS